METKLTGGCFCGHVKYEVWGGVRRANHCHCMHCRRTTGAPFVTWIEINAADFTIVEGEPRQLESKPVVTRQFCGRCGTQLTYQRSDEPHKLDITAGSFDDPNIFAPRDHIWCRRKLFWIKLDDGLPQFEEWRVPRTD